MYTVYQHVNTINGKKYVGITSRNPEERWGRNGSNYQTSPHFYAAIQKYGWDNFEHNILFTCLSKEEACEKEQELIKLYNLTDKTCGYNSTPGGESYQMTDEIKQKISVALMGNQNSAGHICSEETRKKISKALIGTVFSEERLQHMSEAAKNRHVPCSEEKKMKLRQNYPHKRKVYCVELDTIYESVQECGRQLGLHATTVSKVCRGILKTTGGYHLQYAE